MYLSLLLHAGLFTILHTISYAPSIDAFPLLHFYHLKHFILIWNVRYVCSADCACVVFMHLELLDKSSKGHLEV